MNEENEEGRAGAIEEMRAEMATNEEGGPGTEEEIEQAAMDQYEGDVDVEGIQETVEQTIHYALSTYFRGG